ncbi:MAG: PQQ-dependent sugar dehydrogenase [Rhodospirillaceae bacterium]|nr:PQQ-dependent sugar dehydrogenase [Rhodospirillaceae bacterium]
MTQQARQLTRFLFAAALTCATAAVATISSWAQTFEQTPGLVLSFDPSALPAPYATPSATNFSVGIAMPQGATLNVPQGFNATIFAQNLAHPRNLIVAPNGDVFLAEQNSGRVTLLRDADGDGRADLTTTFASGYAQPYGLALTSTHLYVADTQALWRVPYAAGATAASGNRVQLTANNALGGSSGHSTRNLVLSPTGDRAYVAVGSAGNIAEEAEPRATIQEFTLNAQTGAATAQRTFAAGLRNPVGLGFYPGTADLYTVVQERDGMGDELVPDYLTRVTDGGFYGWPYSYIGRNAQPNFVAQNPAAAAARVASALTPDLAFRSHSSALGMTFYNAQHFPAAYRGGAFVALHGSWNAAQPRAYNVVYVPFKNQRPLGHYTVFASGFWTATAAGRAQTVGRPAAVAVANDGALLIADDGARVIWRVAFTGGNGGLTNVLASGSPAGRSFLRLFNDSTSPGSVTLVIRRAGDGQVLGSWLSPQLPAKSARQYEISQIESGASPAIATGGAGSYSIEFRPAPAGLAGGVQYALWNPSAGLIENMSHCQAVPFGDTRTLINVHAGRIATYPSTVRIYNAGAGTQGARLTVRDASTGGVLGIWISPEIPPGAVLGAAVSVIEQGLGPSTMTAEHYVVSLDDAFTGTLQHIVTNPNGVLTDLTTRCAMAP